MIASVIVRTYNEGQWIRRCLVALQNQDCEDFEIIVVDSGSTDNTIEIVNQFDVKLLRVEGRYFPGKSLNAGISNSSGRYAAILSAHCIPLNDKWLQRMLVCFAEPNIACVYGMQEPLPDSDPFDKRDLWTVFGKEKKIQKKDYFFHNANSMIKRDIWENLRFDETLPSLEDQAWAKQVINQGYYIMYEPNASVYHFHGIHQGRDEKRADRVVKVIELLKQDGIT
ncbi:MAG: glycosyltransferase [Nitrospirae bacterium YQR-1]